jgi:hypothetical protein
MWHRTHRSTPLLVLLIQIPTQPPFTLVRILRAVSMVRQKTACVDAHCSPVPPLAVVPFCMAWLVPSLARTPKVSQRVIVLDWPQALTRTRGPTHSTAHQRVIWRRPFSRTRWRR